MQLEALTKAFASLPRRWKFLLRGVGKIVVLSGFLYVILNGAYIYYPRTPNPSLGRVVPYEVNGIVVYIDEHQRSMISWLGWTQVFGAALAVGCVVVDWRLRAKSKQS